MSRTAEAALVAQQAVLVASGIGRMIRRGCAFNY